MGDMNVLGLVTAIIEQDGDQPIQFVYPDTREGRKVLIGDLHTWVRNSWGIQMDGSCPDDPYDAIHTYFDDNEDDLLTVYVGTLGGAFDAIDLECLQKRTIMVVPYPDVFERETQRFQDASGNSSTYKRNGNVVTWDCAHGETPLWTRFHAVLSIESPAPGSDGLWYIHKNIPTGLVQVAVSRAIVDEQINEALVIIKQYASKVV